LTPFSREEGGEGVFAKKGRESCRRGGRWRRKHTAPAQGGKKKERGELNVFDQ